MTNTTDIFFTENERISLYCALLPLPSLSNRDQLLFPHSAMMPAFSRTDSEKDFFPHGRGADSLNETAPYDHVRARG